MCEAQFMAQPIHVPQAQFMYKAQFMRGVGGYPLRYIGKSRDDAPPQKHVGETDEQCPSLRVMI